MNDAMMVSQLTGCSQEEASQALLKYESVEDAVESLLPPAPVVSGSKYIPSKPIVDTGLSDEQKELCERGRWLQSKINAVFSVAHSKTLPPPHAPQEVVADVPVPQGVTVESSESVQNEPLPDCAEQTVPQVLKSETLLQRDSSLRYDVSNALLAQSRHFHCPTNESQ